MVVSTRDFPSRRLDVIDLFEVNKPDRAVVLCRRDGSLERIRENSPDFSNWAKLLHQDQAKARTQAA